MIFLPRIYYLSTNIMSPESLGSNYEASPKIPLTPAQELKKGREDGLKTSANFLAQLSQDIGKGEQITTLGVPKNIEVDTSDITESLASKYPNQAKFIKLLITPGVKISGDAYREIYDKLDMAIYSIDLNFGPRLVRARLGEVNRIEQINFGDPNSTNIVVQNLRAIVREMNAKYFHEAISPFNPALYN